MNYERQSIIESESQQTRMPVDSGSMDIPSAAGDTEDRDMLVLCTEDQDMLVCHHVHLSSLQPHRQTFSSLILTNLALQISQCYH